MQVETLRDVLHWTEQFHQCLADCLEQSEDKTKNERVIMLLKYLKEHEQKLVGVIEEFEKTTSENVLNTWCYEFFDKHPIIRHQQFDCSFSELEPSKIIAEVINLHEQVIELYRYLQSRAEPESSQEVLSQLTELEKHEAMRMVHSANRLEDL